MVKKSSTIREAIAVIDRGAMQVALVVDEMDKLIGTVTDGDVRRGLLRGVSLDDPVESVCNFNPVTASLSDDLETLNQIMIKYELHQIPILDESGKVIGIRYIDDLLITKKKENLAVLMAGGLGKRY